MGDKWYLVHAETLEANGVPPPPSPPPYWLAAAVERSAMALADCRLWPGAWSQANEVERNAWLFEARAAIIAALEMTDG